jgi:DNA-binding LacI/PurR family transcriptional regulator
VLNPLLYITAATCVMDLGLKIPRDLSLMTTYGDPFLSYVHPSPARYTFSPDTSARKTYRVLQNILRREPLSRPRTRLVPDYVRGESVGRASGS